MSTNSTDDLGRDSGSQTLGPSPGSQTLGPSPVVIQFFGLYGPRTLYLPIISHDTPNSIWYWVFGARVRTRTHAGAHKKKQ